MTQHPDISRRPGPRRAALRTGTMSAIVLAAMLFVGSASVPATAGPSSTGPASPATDIAAEDVGAVPAAPSDQGTVGVSIIEISHPVAQPGDDVTIRARITNNTDAAVFGIRPS
jgi:hypothetical protein